MQPQIKDPNCPFKREILPETFINSPESSLMISRSFDNVCFDTSPLSFFLAISLYLSFCHSSPAEVMRMRMFSYLCDRHLHPPVWWPPFCPFSAIHPSVHPSLGDKSRKAVLYSTFNSTSMNQSLAAAAAAAARDTFSCFTLGALW